MEPTREPSSTEGMGPVASTVVAPGVAPRELLVSLLVLAVATVLVYSNTFQVPFQFDDFTSIVQNDSIRDLGSHWAMRGSRGLGYLSFALNYRLGGLDVVGYHAVNLCIHVCNALLVFWLAAVTLRTPTMQRAEAGPLVRRHLPLAAALLFAVHPIATQAVTYVVQRFTSLATLFFLLSLVLYAEARLSGRGRGRSRARAACLLLLSVVAAAGAMKTKEISFTLPFVAIGYEWLFFDGDRRRALLLAPVAGVALLLVPVGLATLDLRLPAETTAIPRSTYLLTELRVVVEYLRLFVLPVGQNFDHDFPLSHSLADPAVLFAVAVLLAVAGAAVLLLVRARRTSRAAGVLVFFGIAWLFVTLSVEPSVIPISDVMVEHRMYLPSAGAAIALATVLLVGVQRLRLRGSPALQVAAALALTAGPLGAAAYARNLVYRDAVTLWRDVVTKTPGNARGHLGLGQAYHAGGRLDDAVRELEEAVRLGPARAASRYALGIAYDSQGRTDDAIREYHETIRLEPALAEVRNNLGFAYRASGQLDDAEREFRDDIQRDPGPASAEAHNNLAGILSEQGRVAEAIEEYRRALALKPLPAIVLNLGRTLDANGRTAEAITEYQRFLDGRGAPDPEHAEAVRTELTRLRSSLRPGAR